jgi:hypothetical protein
VSNAFLNAVEHGAKRLPDERFARLPEAIRARVAGAMIADLRARIAKLEELL